MQRRRPPEAALAQAVRGYAEHPLAYDHKHRHVSDKGVPYEFQDTQQLLVDFFAEVDRVLDEIGKP
jgi:hypothetical protein